MTFVAFALVCVLPAVAFVLFSRGFDWLVNLEPGGRRRPPAPDPQQLLAALGADLRRLTGEHAWLLRADVPGKAGRLKAVRLAYDDTLRQAADVLDVPLPPPPLPDAVRLQAEAELSCHGFTW